MNQIPRDVVGPVNKLLVDIATPRALTVSLLLKYGEYDQLANLSCDPLLYSDPLKFKWDAAATSILRKLKELPTTGDRAQVAEENFLLSEKQCYATNERLCPFLFGSLSRPEDEGILLFINKVRKNVASILGKVPDDLIGRFGPGSTYGDKGDRSTIPHKMSSSPTLTPSAKGFLFDWVFTKWASACCDTPIGRERVPTYVPGNRFLTVPKDCTKDRGIAVEPSINSFYQLAIGRRIRHQLALAGINLANGQEIHRQVACEASITGDFATLDLSNASDTVCKNLVELLLPTEWFGLLNEARSSKTLFRKKWHLLEKFSSMGNGYTFELETLIFLCLCKTALEVDGLAHKPGSDLFVYGDDIIIPTASSTYITTVLRYFGFSLNMSKSFTKGPFRESCGGDFFEGVDVRPYFLKELPHEPQHFIAMANGIRRMVCKDHDAPIDDHTYRRCWFGILDAIPSIQRRLRGPVGLGDIVIHDVKSKWITRELCSIRYIRTYKPARWKFIPWERFDGSVVLASALYGVFSGGHNYGVMPRDSVIGHRVGWVPFS